MPAKQMIYFVICVSCLIISYTKKQLVVLLQEELID